MNILQDLTLHIAKGCELSAAEVSAALAALLTPEVADPAKADFLTALAAKGETAEEIAAFARELRSRAVDPVFHTTKLLDIVGTGADGANTFNISSCTLFVAAAAGIAVAKHGNRAITSKCGSADVLEHLGVRIEMSPAVARHCLTETGIAFLFAPLYHPAFKIIAPVRQQLAARRQRTIFNILGPLVNPARPTHQLLGVFDRSLVPKFAEVLRLLGLQHALVVHGAGLDELSTLGVNTVAELWHGKLELTERDFRVPATLWRVGPVKPAELAGGDPATNAGIVRGILAGTDRSARRDIVLLNAAAALVVAEVADTFEQGWQRAAELIDSGAALDRLNRFVAVSQQA